MATKPRATPNVPSTLNGLRALKLRELRSLCQEAGLETGGFIERGDFEAALLPFSASTAAVHAEAFARNLRELSAAEVPLRIIFLDVDGVLNTTPRGLHSDGGGGAPRVLDECVQRLANLVRDTQSHIVLSTSWRSCLGLKAELHNKLLGAGLSSNCIIGQTPNIGWTERGREICDWLAIASATEISSWVVLDDMDLSECSELSGRFIWVDDEFGLSDSNVEAARDILLSHDNCPGNGTSQC